MVFKSLLFNELIDLRSWNSTYFERPYKWAVHFALLACTLFVHLPGSLANTEVDSIKEILITHEGIDTQRVNLLNEMAYLLWHAATAESHKYASEAHELAARLQYKKGMAEANLSLGQAHWKKGEFNEGIEKFMLSLQQQRELGDSAAITMTRFHIATAYSSEGIVDVAMRHFRDLLAYYERHPSPEMTGDICQVMGETHIYDKKYEHALVRLEMALKIGTELDNEARQMAAQKSMGRAYIQLGQTEKALPLLNKTLDYYSTQGSEEDMITSRMYLGQAYLVQGNTDQAAPHLQSALNLAENGADELLLELILLELKALEEARGNYKAALEYYERQVTVFNRRNNEKVISKTHELKHDFDKEQAQHEIATLSEEGKMHFTFIIGLSILIVLISISVVMITISHRKARRKDQELHESQQALMSAEIENAKYKERELQSELELKNKELTSYTMNFIQKGTLLKELKDKMDEIQQHASPEVQSEIVTLKTIVKRNTNIDKDWEDFKMYFENVHPAFIQALKRKIPNISSADIKLCTLLKLNLNSKEIADMMGISPDSVKTARYRLRNKMNLNREQNLTDFIAHLDD